MSCDGADVGGDVLALVAVAARRAQHQPAVLVAQRDRQPVDLRLGGEGERLVRVSRPRKRRMRVDELAHVLVGEGVVEREHRHGVRDLGEGLDRRGADLRDGLSSRTSCGKRASIAALRRAQRVIFGVGDLRRVLLVVERVVMGDLAARRSSSAAASSSVKRIDRRRRWRCASCPYPSLCSWRLIRLMPISTSAARRRRGPRR